MRCRWYPGIVAGAVTVVLGGCSTRERPLPSDRHIVVRNAWMRAVDSGSVGGVYLTLVNNDTLDARLSEIATPVATTSTLHETIQEDGMMHMAARSDYLLRSGATVHFNPGGLHIMLEPMTRTVSAGDTVLLYLVFTNGQRLSAEVSVRELTPNR